MVQVHRDHPHAIGVASPTLQEVTGGLRPRDQSSATGTMPTSVPMPVLTSLTFIQHCPASGYSKCPITQMGKPRPQRWSATREVTGQVSIRAWDHKDTRTLARLVLLPPCHLYTPSRTLRRGFRGLCWRQRSCPTDGSRDPRKSLHIQPNHLRQPANDSWGWGAAPGPRGRQAQPLLCGPIHPRLCLCPGHTAHQCKPRRSLPAWAAPAGPGFSRAEGGEDRGGAGSAGALRSRALAPRTLGYLALSVAKAGAGSRAPPGPSLGPPPTGPGLL